MDPQSIKLWRCRGVILAALLPSGLALALALLVLDREPSPLVTGLGWGLWSLAMLAALIMAWRWPRAIYEHLSYRLDETGIVIDSGVLWRSRKALPRLRIQHSDVVQGPLQRRFGVATLKLFTAGSRFTEIRLPGLAHEEALRLRDSLIAEMLRDAG